LLKAVTQRSAVGFFLIDLKKSSIRG